MACRNESEHIKEVLDSLHEQTVRPVEVVIVDDASTDETFNIIKKNVESDWTVIKREKNDERYSSIVNAMKSATMYLKEDFEYIMILDGDTILESEYIEKIIQKFREFPDLGIAGGSLIHKITNKEILTDDVNIVFGSNRIYSKKCWFEINDGKIMKVNSFAWDHEHSVKARNRRYSVIRFDDVISHSIRLPSLKVPSFARGILRYQFGNSLLRIVISSIINFKIDVLSGYIYAMITNKKKIDSNSNIRKMRNKSDYEFLKSTGLTNDR
jgi:glycosyltransferase involved in cell wall biosynthesis